MPRYIYIHMYVYIPVHVQYVYMCITNVEYIYTNVHASLHSTDIHSQCIN